MLNCKDIPVEELKTRNNDSKITKLHKLLCELNEDAHIQGQFIPQTSLNTLRHQLDLFSQKYVEAQKHKKTIGARTGKLSEDQFQAFSNFKSPFFIINASKMVLTKFNQSTLDFFNYKKPAQPLIPLCDILNKEFIRLIESINWKTSSNSTFQKSISSKNGKWLVSFNKIETNKEHVMVAIFITDITHEFEKQKATENLVVRTIVDTQEKERLRFAKDIHDSLGQQLSAISFHLSSLIDNKAFTNEAKNEILVKSQDTLKGVMEETRNICFNLMPKTLENFGLVEAVFELSRKVQSNGSPKFQITIGKKFPALNKSLEIGLFRIIQEFINNSLKHSKAKKIIIELKNNSKELKFLLADDGIGFDKKQLNAHTGRGLKNAVSRVKSYDGEIQIVSELKKGTHFKISIPQPLSTQ